MHRYKIVAQISLIFSIFNLVLAAPIIGQEIHEARPDDGGVVAPEDAAARPNKVGELGAASDTPTTPPSVSSPDKMAPSQHQSSPGGSTSSDYPDPDLSFGSSHSGYSWLMDRPPRLSLNLPPPHSSSSGTSEMPLPAVLQGPGLASPHHSSAGASGISTPTWLQELEQELSPSPQHWAAIWATSETYSSPNEFTPSHHPSSASSLTVPSTRYESALDGSLSSHYFSASDGSESVSPHDSDGPAKDKTEFFDKNMMKNLKIAAGALLVGGAIAGIAGSLIKHHKDRDFQDS